MSKSVEELFKDAPEDATHAAESPYCKEIVTFFKDFSGRNHKFMNHPTMHGWHDSYYDLKDFTIIERPKPFSWSGPQDGLPPVNTVCELKFGHWNDWEECTVLCIGETMVFIRQTTPSGKIFEGSMNRDGVMFRPLKTPEQLAAEQRETAIADMAKVLPSAKHECYTFNSDGSVKPYAQAKEILGLLVDAGFKREVV